MGEPPSPREFPPSRARTSAEKPPRAAPARELLLATHHFPGEYLIKAFGPAREEFRAAVHGSARTIVQQRAEFSERTTRGGKIVCVTLRLQVETVDEVISIYEGLHRIETLAMIL